MILRNYGVDSLSRLWDSIRLRKIFLSKKYRAPHPKPANPHHF